MRFIEILESIEVLDEIKMTTANLKKLAADTDARAGIEFEMIVPNIGSGEIEPDYDVDERAYSFQQIEDFFYDGDNNSRREVQRLIEDLMTDYSEWRYEKIYEDWNSEEGKEFFRDEIDVDFDEDSARDEAAEELKENEPELDSDSDEFREKLEELVKEKKEEWFESEWDRQGKNWDRAFENFSESYAELDEDDFLSAKGLRYFSDIQNTYDINWPVYTRGGDDQEMQDLADDFSDAIGKEVNWSDDYHGAEREPNKYVIEPDSSLDPETRDDRGLEFVSPPLPIDEMLDDFAKVVSWAKRNKCYTNRSTGLHMNVSVPNYSIENLDYVKLALLIGDDYVLQKYGRQMNTYASGALKQIRKTLATKPEIANETLDKLKNNMDIVANKIIHDGVTSKYVSINTHREYVEFRSPGGDWLDEDLNDLVNTLLRFVVGLDAACDPSKYRQEYLKKLYRLLGGANAQDDTVGYFAKFMSGEISRDKFLALMMAKSAKDAPLPDRVVPPRQKIENLKDRKLWWYVSRENQGVEVVASNKEEALNKAAEAYGLSAAIGWKAEPLRPYK